MRETRPVNQQEGDRRPDPRRIAEASERIHHAGWSPKRGAGRCKRQGFTILRAPQGLPNGSRKPFAENYFRTFKGPWRGADTV